MEPPRPRLVVAVGLFLVLAGCADLQLPGLPVGGDPAAPSPSPSWVPAAPGAADFGARSLDGSGNNVANPLWGAVGQPYRRLGAASYAADGAPLDPAAPPRLISNRVFNDTHQNLITVTLVAAWVVVALFGGLVTIERQPLLAVLRALGLRASGLVAGLLVQTVAIALAALVLATVVVAVALPLLPPTVPVLLLPARMGAAAGGLLVAALLGTLGSLRRLLRTDPASAMS